MSAQLSFREWKLIDAFRMCDERGKQLVERTARDEAGADFSHQEGRSDQGGAAYSSSGDIQAVIASLSHGDQCELLGYAKAMAMQSSGVRARPLLQLVK